MTPNVNVESAQPTSFLCVSFHSDTDIEDRDMWGAE